MILVHNPEQNPNAGNDGFFNAAGGINPGVTAHDVTNTISGPISDSQSSILFYNLFGAISDSKSGTLSDDLFGALPDNQSSATISYDRLDGNQAKSIPLQPEPAALTGEVSNLCHQTLNNGASLFAPHQDTVVETPFGSVSISGNSIAMVIASADSLAVYDLHDMHKNSVFVRCGNCQTMVSLTPGRSAVFTKPEKNRFESVNPAQKVAYKNLTHQKIGSQQVYQGEFEITSMIQCLAPLRNMIHSSDHSMRKAAGNMIKTAVILSQLSGGEPYRFFAAPEVTASLPKPNN